MSKNERLVFRFPDIPGKLAHELKEGMKLEACGEGDCEILWSGVAGRYGLGEWARAGARTLFDGDDAAWQALPASQKMRNVELFVNSNAGRKAKAEAEQAENADRTSKLAAKKLVDAAKAAAEGWPGGGAAAGDPERLSDAELIAAIVRDRWSLRRTHQYGWEEICHNGEAFSLEEQSREKCGTSSFTEEARLVRWVRKTAVSVKWEWKKQLG